VWCASEHGIQKLVVSEWSDRARFGKRFANIVAALSRSLMLRNLDFLIGFSGIVEELMQHHIKHFDTSSCAVASKQWMKATKVASRRTGGKRLTARNFGCACKSAKEVAHGLDKITIWTGACQWAFPCHAIIPLQSFVDLASKLPETWSSIRRLSFSCRDLQAQPSFSAVSRFAAVSAWSHFGSPSCHCLEATAHDDVIEVA